MFVGVSIETWGVRNWKVKTSWAYENKSLNQSLKCCLIYPLIIPHSNQNLFFLLEAQYQSFQNWHFGNISPCYENSFKISYFDGKCKVHSLFIVSRPSTLIQLSIQGLLIATGKPIRNVCLGTVKHDCASIVWRWTHSKHFLSARGNIFNSKVAFYNKTTCLLRQGCCNRELSVVTSV